MSTHYRKKAIKNKTNYFSNFTVNVYMKWKYVNLKRLKKKDTFLQNNFVCF